VEIVEVVYCIDSSDS